MDCIELKSRIDAYIDGELSPEKRAEMLEHAQNCENCRAELKYADMLREMMGDMPVEITPPLEVQAAWRAAIRSEGNIARLKRKYRTFSAVAAALVVFIGCAAVFGVQMKNGAIQPANQADDKGGVFTYVAADGGDEDTGSLAVTNSATGNVVTASAKLMVSDLSKASETVLGLVDEFNGYVGASSVSASTAYITAYIPADEVAVFMDTLNYAGNVENFRISGDGDGMASIAITIKSR